MAAKTRNRRFADPVSGASLMFNARELGMIAIAVMPAIGAYVNLQDKVATTAKDVAQIQTERDSEAKAFAQAAKDTNTLQAARDNAANDQARNAALDHAQLVAMSKQLDGIAADVRQLLSKGVIK